MRIQQLIKKPRKSKKTYFKKIISPPQFKAVCQKVFTMAPRKPNSASRKVVKLKRPSGTTFLAYVPGEGGAVQEHSSLLVQKGGAKDLPNVNFRVIRGTLECPGVVGRKTSRSKYGTKK